MATITNRQLAGALTLASMFIDCSGSSQKTAAVTSAVREARCQLASPKSDDDPCSAPLAAGSDRLCRFEFGGKTREFLLYAPAKYDPCKPAALVVDAHGATESAAQHVGRVPFKAWPNGFGSGWRLLADREGFVVATPQGIDDRWNEGDVDFIVEVERKIAKVAKLDPRRVYLTGISNGGYLAYWTGCRDVDVFRGFAVVAGAAKLSAPTCKTTRPATLVAFHAKGDAIVPYESGHEAAKMWAAASQCKRGPTPAISFGGAVADTRARCVASAGAPDKWKLTACDAGAPATACEAWDECAGGAKVTFCTVAADKQPVGGHVLYFNDTKLSLAAAAWELLEAR